MRSKKVTAPLPAVLDPDPTHASTARVRSADGVEIAYASRGDGAVALVFIHGGLADRSFWAPQFVALADAFRLVAIDLAGHGESGRDRSSWTIPAFGQDVRAVVEALDLPRVVVIGNSLGGPVALEAARLLTGRVVGVIGVDTLHDVTVTMDAAESRERAAAFRDHFAETCHEMVTALFHPGRHVVLREWAEQRMLAMPPEVVAGIMEGFAGYDLASAARNARAPLRAINGDLWPIDLAKNRAVVPDFDARILSDTGHYPMLERPDEFNRVLVEVVSALAARDASSSTDRVRRS